MESEDIVNSDAEEEEEVKVSGVIQDVDAIPDLDCEKLNSDDD